MSFSEPCMYPSVLASLSRSKSFCSRRISPVTIDTRDYFLNKISKKDVTGPCNLCLLYDAFFFATAQSVLLNCQDSCCLSLKGSSWISLQSSMARAAKQIHSITPKLMLCPGTAAHMAIWILKQINNECPHSPSRMTYGSQSCRTDDTPRHIVISLHFGYCLYSNWFSTFRFRRAMEQMAKIVEIIVSFSKGHCNIFGPVFISPQVEPTAPLCKYWEINESITKIHKLSCWIEMEFHRRDRITFLKQQFLTLLIWWSMV